MILPDLLAILSEVMPPRSELLSRNTALMNRLFPENSEQVRQKIAQLATDMHYDFCKKAVGLSVEDQLILHGIYGKKYEELVKRLIEGDE